MASLKNTFTALALAAASVTVVNRAVAQEAPQTAVQTSTSDAGNLHATAEASATSGQATQPATTPRVVAKPRTVVKPSVPSSTTTPTQNLRVTVNGKPADAHADAAAKVEIDINDKREQTPAAPQAVEAAAPPPPAPRSVAPTRHVDNMTQPTDNCKDSKHAGIIVPSTRTVCERFENQSSEVTIHAVAGSTPTSLGDLVSEDGETISLHADTMVADDVTVKKQVNRGYTQHTVHGASLVQQLTETVGAAGNLLGGIGEEKTGQAALNGKLQPLTNVDNSSSSAGSTANSSGNSTGAITTSSTGGVASSTSTSSPVISTTATGTGGAGGQGGAGGKGGDVIGSGNSKSDSDSSSRSSSQSNASATARQSQNQQQQQEQKQEQQQKQGIHSDGHGGWVDGNGKPCAAPKNGGGEHGGQGGGEHGGQGGGEHGGQGGHEGASLELPVHPMGYDAKGRFTYQVLTLEVA